MFRRLGSVTARAAQQRPRAVCRARSTLATHAAAAQPAASTSALHSDPFGKIKSTDIFGGSNPRLNAALITALSPPSHGGQASTSDPAEVLAAVRSYLDAGAELPITHRNAISALLSSYYTDVAAPEEQLSTLADALWSICGDPKSVYATSARGKLKHYMLVVRYAKWMASEAGRDETRARIVLDAFERQLATMSSEDKAGDGRAVFPSQAAAWVLLRARLGIAEPTEIRLRMPSLASVMGQVVKLGGEKDAPEVQASARALFSNDAIATLPSTARSLEGRLAFLRGDGNLTHIANMWETFTGMLDRKEKHGLTADGGSAALGAFIWACSPWRNELKQDRAALLPILEAARARVPEPTPLPVFHAMLRASRPADPDEIDPDEVNPRAADRDFVLASAKATWDKVVRMEGVIPDVQAYSVYLRLLGYHGESGDMFKIWDDLVRNEETRKLWLEELEAEQGRSPSEAERMVWPPTLVFNQVLSSAFMIGGRPAEMGMRLFEAAVNPSTSLVADVVTINTVLRWAAHLANIQMINEVIATAGKLKIKPDIVTYTTMVHGLLRAERSDLARATLDAMRSRGIEPNDVMASMLVADLASDGTAEGLRRAEYVIRDMRARGLKTTLPMWTALVGGYFCGGWDLDGWDAIKRMKASGHRLNDKAFNIILKQLTRGPKSGAPEANNRVLFGMGDAEGGGSTAIRVFRQMVREGGAPNADTYSIILDPLVKAKRVSEVKEVLGEMERRAFQTQRPSLKRMIDRARKLVGSRQR
ncbi:hypothetical protein CC85DRAFT_23249 [Cutaneotrichosporon oleaginosum]|uniref:Pentacotripeptide-repeat region of PRORP domain-containing protein n=1 Tax=Cutaneotrichosporon oleaginosum TaxID=879819 RepID=A0A0J0XSZ2_9TREE|nr:uncharacterized protein CC85DRAFT_23249 [Cutaneotrichosporon oleaginosum]KLT44192.1 hypothetical protein CC85DRAFT_23249 [Cutaneotrichosporon oleaginosum]TXT11639.1 hypothetical protein COLE_02049 [Cutaneotrichosporon oleaginosum]